MLVNEIQNKNDLNYSLQGIYMFFGKVSRIEKSKEGTKINMQMGPPGKKIN